ncbi:immunoglobulin lambda-1 light chain-like [Odocoileus virginianus]|uniref:immunoglobulin lambda-1 light chain-like n=1 Tax=Odocoileus virginianus TaxID=9874 RepID=UPI0038F7170F
MSCFQQKPGSPPQDLLMFKSDSNKPQGSRVPSHFSGSKDASANAGLLLISGLQPEDEADYNCATVHQNTGSWAQAVLTQPPSVSGSPGQRVTITCSGSSSNIGILGVSWYQQLPGSAPKTLIYDSNKRPTGVPDRFSGTKSGNTGTLTITSLQAEDEADYYSPASGLRDGLDGPWVDPYLHGSPSSGRGWKRTGGLGQPSPTVATRVLGTVAWTPLLLELLSLCTGSVSQPVLTQPAPLSASPGASARLSCTLSSGYSVGSYTIYWYQQKAGSPPQYLLRVKSDLDKHQGSRVPSRFSGSKDALTNAGLLLISGLQPEDEADYDCAVWHGGSNAYTALQTREEVRQKPPLTPARGSDEVSFRG